MLKPVGREGIGVVADPVAVRIQRFRSVVGEGIGVVADPVAVAVQPFAAVVGEGVGRVTVTVSVIVRATVQVVRGRSSSVGAVVAGVGNTVPVEVVLVDELKRRRERMVHTVLVDDGDGDHTR